MAQNTEVIANDGDNSMKSHKKNIYHNRQLKRQWNNAMLLSANEYCSQYNENLDNLNVTWFSAAAYIFELGLLH
jgi:hypothetical protein